MIFGLVMIRHLFDITQHNTVFEAVVVFLYSNGVIAVIDFVSLILFALVCIYAYLLVQESIHIMILN